MTRGKRKQLHETWRQRVADYRASGMTGSAWCAAHQVKEHRLWYWARKFPQESASESQHGRFISVLTHEPTDTKERPPLLIRVQGVEIEIRPGFDTELLRDVVRTLVPHAE